MRKRTAQKLGNPRLNRITFHTLRYWRATIAYDYSKGDLTYVQEILGHKNIENTRRYTRYCKARHGDERFIVKVARNAKEACELVENGYDYVTGKYEDGGKIFRKQKRSFLGSWSTKMGSWSSMDSHPSGDNSSHKSTFLFLYCILGLAQRKSGFTCLLFKICAPPLRLFVESINRKVTATRKSLNNRRGNRIELKMI